MEFFLFALLGAGAMIAVIKRVDGELAFGRRVGGLRLREAEVEIVRDDVNGSRAEVDDGDLLGVRTSVGVNNYGGEGDRDVDGFHFLGAILYNRDGEDEVIAGEIGWPDDVQTLENDGKDIDQHNTCDAPAVLDNSIELISHPSGGDAADTVVIAPTRAHMPGETYTHSALGFIRDFDVAEDILMVDLQMFFDDGYVLDEIDFSGPIVFSLIHPRRAPLNLDLWIDTDGLSDEHIVLSAA